jgi:hypothetical protein
MRFKQYLIEKDETKEVSADILKVRKDCKIFINWMKTNKLTNPIFRGRNNVDDITLMTRRRNRTPMNTRLPLQKILDSLFQEKFGWKPRSAGVFTSANVSQVQSYGRANIFFPIGNYRYVWNPEISDLFCSMDMSNAQQCIGFDSEKNAHVLKKGTKEKATTHLQKLVDGCIDYDLEKAIKEQLPREIMFDVNRYYLISTNINDRFYDRSAISMFDMIMEY